jgi:ABC-type multidrug transport system fused ATPase/permease subunit
MQMAMLAVSIFVLKSGFSLFFSWKLYEMLAKRSNTISDALLNDFLETPFIWVRKMDDQTLPFAFMEGINALTIGVLANLILIASDGAMMVILFAGLLKMNLIATVISVVLFGSLTYFLIKLLAPRIRHIGSRSAELSIQGRNAILDIKEMFQEFPSRKEALYFETKARSIRSHSSDNYAREQWLTGLPKSVLETAGIVGIFIILVLAGLTGTTQSNVGLVTVFLGATARIVPAILRIQANWLTVNRNVGYVDQALPVLEKIRSTSRSDHRFSSNQESGDSTTHRTGGLEFQKVSFRFPDAGEPTITNLSFVITPGEKIAIVGDSGAGKTTVANLILGLLTPTSGAIQYEYGQGNRSVSNLSETGYLPQRPYIFSGSILENVCLTNNEDEIDKERFERAINEAQVANFIHALPEGALTITGSSGISLSGGEKQRLALARVLYLSPSVIVLDEPTSSLDSETDEFVSRTLTSPELNSTVFVVAHRYSTVKSVNRILYLENGELVAFGTWDELMQTVPRFAIQAKLQGLS